MKSWSMQTFAVKDGIVFNLANLQVLDFSPQPVPSNLPWIYFCLYVRGYFGKGGDAPTAFHWPFKGKMNFAIHLSSSHLRTSLISNPT